MMDVKWAHDLSWKTWAVACHSLGKYRAVFVILLSPFSLFYFKSHGPVF